MAKNKLMMKALQELSLVDSPANQHASVAIFKRAAAGKAVAARKRFAAVFKLFLDAVAPPAQIEKEAQSYASTRAVNELWERTNALSSSISSIFADANDSATKSKLIDATISQFRDDMQALNVDDSAFAALEDAGEQVGKTGAADDDDEKKNGTTKPAATATDDDTDTKGNTMKNALQTFTDVAAANAHIAKLAEDNGKLEGRVEELESAADPIAAITKGMAPAAAALVRKQHETIQTLTGAQAQTELVAKAVKIAKKTGADVDKLARVLKLVGDDKDAEAFVTDVFAKYDGMLSEIEGMEFGSTSEEGATDAMGALDAAAAEIRKANPKMTKAQSIQKALDENPDLYNATELSEPAAV